MNDLSMAINIFKYDEICDFLKMPGKYFSIIRGITPVHVMHRGHDFINDRVLTVIIYKYRLR